MQTVIDELEVLAEKLNLSKDEMLRESLRIFLEKKLREIKIEIFELQTKYGISSVEEFDELYREGKIDEKGTWQDNQKLDHLEFKKEELEKALRPFT